MKHWYQFGLVTTLFNFLLGIHCTLYYMVFKILFMIVAMIITRTRSLKWIIEDQAFSPSYDLAPPSPSSSASKLDWRRAGRLRKRDNLLTGDGGWGRGRSQIIRRRRSLDLYNSVNTLCLHYGIIMLCRAIHWQLKGRLVFKSLSVLHRILSLKLIKWLLCKVFCTEHFCSGGHTSGSRKSSLAHQSGKVRQVKPAAGFSYSSCYLLF